MINLVVIVPYSPLVHSLYRDESVEICLLTKDPSEEYKKLLADKDIKGVAKVIALEKLRKNYKPYEAKRKLCMSYDLFLADERILHKLPPLLGKYFFKRKR